MLRFFSRLGLTIFLPHGGLSARKHLHEPWRDTAIPRAGAAPGALSLNDAPLVVLIEIVSFLVRPLTLALRLFGNMVGGHVVLKIFAGFVIALGGLGVLGWAGAALALTSVVALTALEFMVAFLQAFVFAVLTCVYLNDAIHTHH